MSRVVITGVGMVSSLGVTLPETFNAICARTLPEPPVYRVTSAFDPDYAYQLISNTKTLQQALLVTAATEALDDAGWNPTEEQEERSGVVESFMCAPSLELDRTYWLKANGGIGTSNLARLAQFKGPTSCVGVGLQALGLAYNTIKRGEADLMVACGASPEIDSKLTEQLKELGLLGEVCKPFDRNREGMVLGEGSAVLVLEKLEQALERETRIYCEVTGFSSVFRPLSLMLADSESSHMKQEQVDYIFANCSGTQKGDASEAVAIKKSFPQAKVTGVKGSLGHTLSAAGLIETGIAATCMQQEIVPPITPFPDSELDVNFQKGLADEEFNNIMVMSSEFGSLDAVTLKRFSN